MDLLSGGMLTEEIFILKGSSLLYVVPQWNVKSHITTKSSAINPLI
jgi:hypothetical protein